MKYIEIRIANEMDAEEILEIYTPYITDTAITFEYSIPSIDDFKNRIKEICLKYPYLVCLINKKIVGYAYAHEHNERTAYQWNVELSIYVDKKFISNKIGIALYNSIIDILKLQNIQNLYASITSPNIKSEKLHQRFGFKLCGIYHNTGYKFDCWHDVMLFEKHIGNHSKNPNSIKTIKQVNSKEIAAILNENINLIAL
ncbi:N-acetyltransferase family protein [Clostridioides difficile]